MARAFSLLSSEAPPLACSLVLLSVDELSSDDDGVTQASRVGGLSPSDASVNSRTSCKLLAVLKLPASEVVMRCALTMSSTKEPACHGQGTVALGGRKLRHTLERRTTLRLQLVAGQ